MGYCLTFWCYFWTSFTKKNDLEIQQKTNKQPPPPPTKKNPEGDLKGRRQGVKRSICFIVHWLLTRPRQSVSSLTTVVSRKTLDTRSQLRLKLGQKLLHWESRVRAIYPTRLGKFIITSRIHNMAIWQCVAQNTKRHLPRSRSQLELKCLYVSPSVTQL